MATAKLNNFTFQQLSQAVSQIFDSDRVLDRQLACPLL
jgi:hypothetical protein